MLIFFLSFLFFNCTEEWIRTDIDGRVCVAGGGGGVFVLNQWVFDELFVFVEGR